MRCASITRLCAVFLVFCALALAAQQAAESIAKQFENRVANYVKLRDSQGKPPTRPVPSASQVTDKRKDLAAKVQAARANAKEGDIFGPPVGDFFRQKIKESFAGPQGSRIRTSLRDAEPVSGIRLAVNEPYPQGVPLQSTPASLLLNLPAISQGLQYRIVGRNLVLLDTNTNLIVDVLRDAIPI